MKTQIRTNSSLDSLQLARQLALALAATLAVFSMTARLAGASSTTGSDELRDGMKIASGLSGEDLAADTDEGVGSLPLVIDPASNSDDKKGDLDNDVIASRRLRAPFVRIVGSWDDLDAVVIQSSGLGFIYATPLAAPIAPALSNPTTSTPPSASTPTDSTEEEKVRKPEFEFRFYGTIELELDLVELELRGIELEFSANGEFSGALSTFCWGDLCTPILSVPIEDDLFSVSDLVGSGVLLEDSVKFYAVSANMSSVTVDFSLSSASTLKISQGVVLGSSK